MTAAQTTGNPLPEGPLVIEYLDPSILQPHPSNLTIYAATKSVDDLAEAMDKSRWIRPLRVSWRTGENVVVQGHRRLRAVRELGWDRIPVEDGDYATEEDELRDLLLDNVQRVKTTEEKVREAG